MSGRVAGAHQARGRDADALPPPGHPAAGASAGAIAYDLLEGHEIARQRPNPTPQVEGFSDYKKWSLEHFYTKRLLSEESIPC
jgi:hypothetical protein